MMVMIMTIGKMANDNFQVVKACGQDKPGSRMRSLTNPIMAAFSTQEWASCNVMLKDVLYFSPRDCLYDIQLLKYFAD